LAPGESVTCTATYTITQADLDRGYVTNSAYATDGTTTSEPDEETANATQTAALTIDKTITSGGTYAAVDDVVSYSYEITNSGNVTLAGPFTVEDDVIGTLTDCAAGPLAPGASVTCTATYTITQADLDRGYVTNSAYATDGTTTSEPDEETATFNNLPPSITCPTMPIITPCSQEVSGLAAMISDPNNNIVSLTWIMTGATNASSPTEGINNLDSYTFEWGTTTVTYTVTDALGLTASCSFTVTVTPCEEGDGYCTYTQGFYGNEGGLSCEGLTAYELMVNAFNGGALTSKLFGLESTGYNFTLYYEDITNKSIFRMLPGGGPSQPLTGEATYSNRSTWNYVPISGKKGSINNNLLAQTIVLWFNMQNDAALGSLMITDRVIVTLESEECGEGDPIPGTELYTQLPQSILNYFGGEGFTVNELFNLANEVLGGANTAVSPSDVQMAVDAINNAFDECRILAGFQSALPGPALKLVKTSTTVPNTFDSQGDVLTYDLVVTNTGDVTLTNIVVSDPIAVVTGSPVTSLAPGASIKLTAQYVVTSADMNAGRVYNVATASAMFGETVIRAIDDEVISSTNMPPSVACPSMPAITSCSQVVSNLAARYSDPDHNIVSLTWEMNGATVAASPASGINNLDTYIFEWGTTTVTYTVKDALGAEASCSFIVTVTSCDAIGGYCTYTQGFYGNEGGRTCDGRTALNLMKNAFGNGSIPFVNFGSNNLYFQLKYTDITKLSIFKMLPGGGASAALTGKATYSDSKTWGYVPIARKTGVIMNSLLAQTITLWFNMQNDEGLNSLEILGRYIVTAESRECGSDNYLPGTEWYAEIPESVWNYFGGAFTVYDLYTLANDVLGGVVGKTTIAPAYVTEAIDAINNAFDECRVLLRFESTQPFDALAAYPTSESKSDALVVDETLRMSEFSEVDLTVYPNPFAKVVRFEIEVIFDTHVDLDIYTHNGALLKRICNEDLKAGDVRIVEFDASLFPHATFLYKLSTNLSMKSGTIMRIK
jgi:uncharacterized repeat protein (TIGR01451 family)